MLNAAITLAQSSSDTGSSIIQTIVGILLLLIYIAILVVVIAGAWKVFTKAGQPGWACLIPFYNLYVVTQIVGRPWWWLILMCIPFIQIVFIIIICNDLSKAFGRGLGTTLGLIFLNPIFTCILGFGSAQYQGPART